MLLSGGGEFAHGLTYSGHLASCAAGLATLDILEETRIIEEGVVELAPYFASRLNELADHPIVGQVRVKGLFAAAELCAISHPGSDWLPIQLQRCIAAIQRLRRA